MARQTAPRPYLTVAQAAELLNVTERTIRAFIADSRLPAYRLGARNLRLKPEDVEALLRPIPATTGAGRRAV